MVTRDTAEAGLRPAPQAYDFGRPTKLAREHSRLLEMVYETVARQWATILGSELGCPCQVVLSGVEQISYDDYISPMSSPSLLAIFNAEPHPGASFLAMPIDVGYLAIERMLGGRGDVPQPQRVPTEIETQLVVKVLERLLGELHYGLAAINDITATLRSIETNPQFVQVAAATDLYIVASLDVTIDEVVMPATVAMPAPVLAMRSADAGGVDPAVAAERLRSRRAMSELVADVPVDVLVRFSPRVLPSQQLTQLGVGDVISLGHPIDRPLDVVSAGVVCAHGVAGTQGARAACLITSSAVPADPRSFTRKAQA